MTLSGSVAGTGCALCVVKSCSAGAMDAGGVTGFESKLCVCAMKTCCEWGLIGCFDSCGFLTNLMARLH